MANRCIYFAGSIRAGRQDVNVYAKVVEILKKYGTVLTEHVGDPNLTEAGKLATPLPSCHSFMCVCSSI